MRFYAIFLLALGAMMFSVSPATAMDHGESKAEGEKEYECDKDKKGHKMTFSGMDSNEDGSISKGEFISAHTKMAERKFEHVDEDGDGVLNEAELETHHEKMKDKKSKR